MLFQTVEFFVFYIVITACYFAFHPRYRTGLLLAASYYFYMCWDYRFGSLILLSTLIDYYCCLGMDSKSERRRLYLVVSIVANLGILGFFKYTNFFIDSFIDFSALFGAELRSPSLDIILPVGISFFTFQSMSRTIDVYRGEIEAERDFPRFALFVAFFPQLVAGPIVRARDFLPQLRRRFAWSNARLAWGLERFLIGLVKKVVIADNLSPLVDLVYREPEPFGAALTWLATLCYAVQIYADFSGYSDMAIGLARILGFKIPENFDTPYMSRTPSEFWRRWHISLSGWLRDYLYIPLGGNRGGAFKTQRNLMITMLLGGLWHGASYNFILWGALHGLLLVVYRPIERALAPYKERDNIVFKALSIALFFGFVLITWVPFRAKTLPDALAILGKMFGLGSGPAMSFELVGIDPWITGGALFITAAGTLYYYAWSRKLHALRRTAVDRAVSLAALVVLATQYSYLGRAPFVYFQF